ncbi:MAG: efflux ABC transporter, permease protein [uncultured bacterium]|nr:MAG: efflux ABC transporter, permease protein [uncultured bacterium]
MNQNASNKRNVILNYFLMHIRACQFSLSELYKAPIAQCVTIIVIAIAVILPLGFFIVLKNLQTLDSKWNGNTPTISLYLKTDFDQDQIQTYIAQLKTNSKIAQITYISPEEGLKNFESTSQFGDVLSKLSSNPLPGIVTVLPTVSNQNPASISALFAELKRSPLVDVAQLDLDWVKRLYNMIIIGEKITNALSVLFAFGVLMIIGNTLRISLLAHLREIRVLKLIGATNAFIRRPFLYRGVLYGLCGGLLAYLLLNLFMLELQKPVLNLTQTYNTQFQLQSLSLFNGAIVLVLCGLLGFMSSWIILNRFLNQPEKVD